MGLFCNVKNNINGKKRYFAVPIGGGLTFWLIRTIFVLNATVAVNAADNVAQAKEIKRVEELPQKVSKIEEKVESIDRQFTEFRGDYKKDQSVLQQDIKDILKAVNKL